MFLFFRCSIPNEVTQDAYALGGESQSQPQPQHVINESDIIVEKMHIHYGLKDKVW
jgi:hypothetical protein